MAFGRLGNRHDSWRRFCALYRELLARAELPDMIALNPDRFYDLLRDGVSTTQGATASLNMLSAEQWSGLTRFAAVFFHECESYAPLDQFPAFRREGERRGDVLPVEWTEARRDGAT